MKLEELGMKLANFSLGKLDRSRITVLDRDPSYADISRIEKFNGWPEKMPPQECYLADGTWSDFQKLLCDGRSSPPEEARLRDRLVWSVSVNLREIRIYLYEEGYDGEN